MNRRQSCNLVFSQLNGPTADLPAASTVLLPSSRGEISTVRKGRAQAVPAVFLPGVLLLFERGEPW